jgi:hypothetical protein
MWFVYNPQGFMCWKVGLQCGGVQVAEPLKGNYVIGDAVLVGD